MAGGALLQPAPEAVEPPPAAAAAAAAATCTEQARFLFLPRELRDKIYDHTFGLEDGRSERALRIERRHLKSFRPSAHAILLILHHEYLLISHQIAEEALEVLLKRHTLFLSCGPFVLRRLLEKIEQHDGQGRQWLHWMKRFELDWITFPDLSMYPPVRHDGRDEWYWEHNEEGDEDTVMDDVGGADSSGHYDEYDHDGGHYEDNFFDPTNSSLYPDFYRPNTMQASSSDDPFALAHHYPYTDPAESFSADDSEVDPEEQSATKLELLVSMEVTPLFTYLASPALHLTSITLPLYFISKESYHQRGTARPSYVLPLKLRYWVHVCAHALLLLKEPHSSANPALQEVRVRYRPWDIWATMTPTDDLHRMVNKGIWFDESKDEDDDEDIDEREGEGEAFRAIWAELAANAEEGTVEPRFGLAADVRLVPWEGDMNSWRVGDELDVVFTKSKDKGKK